MKNWKKLLGSHAWIDASFRVKEVFELHLDSADGYIPVRITLYENSAGGFWARPDHYPMVKKGPGVDSMGVAGETESSALEALFTGFEALFAGQPAEKVTWIPEEEYFG